MEKQKEIVTKILNVPIKKWNGYVTEISGVKIIFNPTHSNLPKFFEINGIKFFDERINEFRYKLEDYSNAQKQKTEQVKVDEIYNSLCAGCSAKNNGA